MVTPTRLGVPLGLLLMVATLQSQTRVATRQWRYFGGDEAFTRHSPLDQITAGAWFVVQSMTLNSNII